MTDQTIEPPRIYPTFRDKNAATMIDWLQKAFDFVVRVKYIDGDTVSHAELTLGSSMIMVGEVRDDQYGRMVGAPGDNAGKSVYIAVKDCDAAYNRAKSAGAEILEEPTKRDYGSRDFICRDPQGNEIGR